MLIALDYDGTYTADPQLFDNFARMAMQRGHDVVCVTMHYEHEVIPAPFIEGVGIIYTGRKSKMKFMADKGIQVNVWIDDMPHMITESTSLIIGKPE